MSQVKCKVEECVYNNANLCDAKEIQVCSCGCKNVSCADETSCSTFRSRIGSAEDCHC